MFGLTFFQLVIAIIVALAIFVVLWKFFKIAIEAAFVFALLLVGLYIAFNVLDYQGLNNAYPWLRSVLGF